MASVDQVNILNDLNVTAGGRVALKFRSLFSALFVRLEDHPAIGPRRPALGPGIRIGIVPPYIVIYRHRVRENVVSVPRIVDGRRNITKRLLTGIQ